PYLIRIFFFQAEDGIRDKLVTGVQTCALPISILSTWFDRDLRIAGRVVHADGTVTLLDTDAVARIPNLAIHLDRGVNAGAEIDRSEERRVGKECSSWRTAAQLKKRELKS